MEEVLEVDHRPFDLENPVVAMDEQPIQLLKHTRPIISAAPASNGHAAHPERVDYMNINAMARPAYLCLWLLWKTGGVLRFGNIGRSRTWRRNWNDW